jgi:hypothetical protein
MRVYRLWNPTEEKALKILSEKNLRVDEIARLLNRDTTSIHNKAQRMGISLAVKGEEINLDDITSLKGRI